MPEPPMVRSQHATLPHGAVPHVRCCEGIERRHCRIVTTF